MTETLSPAALVAYLGGDAEAWRPTPLRDAEGLAIVRDVQHDAVALRGGEATFTCAGAPGGAALERFGVRVAPGVQARVVLDLAPEGPLAATALQLDIGAGAEVTLVVRALPAPGWALTGVHAALGERATLRVHTLAGLAVRRSRVAVTARLEGQGAQLHADALFSPSAGARLDHVVHAIHAAPATRSSMQARAVVAEGGSGAFVGRVDIGRGVRGCDARQLLRGLLDGAGASAHLRPELRIDCDDVTASHGAAVGRLDPAQRFYLESRGLPPDVARALLVQAFVGELAGRFPTPEMATDALFAVLGPAAAAAQDAELGHEGARYGSREGEALA